MKSTDVIQFRQTHKLSMKHLGNMVGVSENAVRFWEAGERKVPKPIIKILNLITKYPELLKELEK